MYMYHGTSSPFVMEYRDLARETPLEERSNVISVVGVLQGCRSTANNDDGGGVPAGNPAVGHLGYTSLAQTCHVLVQALRY